MRRIAYLILFVSGCGGGSPTTDMSAVHDMAMGGGDASGPTLDMTMGATNTGTMVASGKGFQMLGITTDDIAVAGQTKTAQMVTLVVVPAAGGMAAQTIATNAYYQIAGKAVIVWENVDMTTLIGDLSVWTAAGGLKPIVAGTALVTDTGVSSDGQTLMYTTAHDGAGATGDVFVSKLDGTGAVKVASGIQTPQMGNCIPFTVAAGAGFVHVYCAGNTPDGGVDATTATVDAVTAAGNVSNILKNGLNFAVTNTAGDKVLLSDALGAASVFPSAGGSGMPIDTKFTAGVFLPDGSVVYTTSDMALKHDVPGSAATTLDATNGGKFFIANPRDTQCPVSWDGKFVAYYSAAAMSGTSDVEVAPTGGGTPAQLVKTQTGLIFGDAFTQDSSRIIYYTDLKLVPIAGNLQGFIGSVLTAPSVGGAGNTHGTLVWVSFATNKPTGLSYNDNFKGATGSNNGVADIKVITDSTKTDPPSVIATKAESDYFPSHDRSKIVYCTHALGAEGIYAATVP